MITEHVAFSGISAAFLCIALVLSKKEVRQSDRYLMLWLVISSLDIAYDLYFAWLPDFLQPFGFTLPVLSTGMLFSYVISMTFDRKSEPDILLKNSLPYFIYNIIFLVVTVFLGKIPFRYGVPDYQYGNIFLLNMLTVPMALIPLAYIVLSYSVLKKYQRLLPGFYSSVEKINLNWLKYLLLSFIGMFILIYGIILASTRSHLIPPDKTFGIVAALQGAFLIAVIFFSLRQSIIVNDPVVLPESAVPPQDKSPKTDERLEELALKLLEFMEHEKPYLKEELSLSLLAESLHLSPNILSQIINQNLQTNFYRFINAYRIAEVRKMLKDPLYGHYSILGMAYEAGFSSKSTFNKIFREETGMTPSEFRMS